MKPNIDNREIMCILQVRHHETDRHGFSVSQLTRAKESIVKEQPKQLRLCANNYHFISIHQTNTE